MKQLTVILGLVVLVTTQSEKNCRREKEMTSYKIYNSTVEIKTFYCFDTVEIEFKCERFNATEAIVNPRDADQYCPYSNISDIKLRRVFCEKTAYANLLHDTVHLESNVTCKYHNKHCNDSNNLLKVFWYGPCVGTFQGKHEDFFNWTVMENQTQFIENQRRGLILGERVPFCDVDVWKTNYKDVIVSKGSDILPNATRNLTHLNFKKVFKELCGSENSTIVPRTWYLYKYPTDVQVYACLKSSTICNGGYSEALLRNDTKLLELCNNICGSRSCKMDAKLCKKPSIVDLEYDEIEGLPGCKYSDGLCEAFKAFWQYTNRCQKVRKLYDTLEQPCEGNKCLYQKGKSGKLILTREGKLCDQTIWYTDQHGVVASEKELGFYQAKSIVLDQSGPLEQPNFSWFQPKLDLHSSEIWGNGEYYLITLFGVCVFCIVLKFAVFPLYLCSNCKTVKKQKLNRSVSEEIELRRMRLVLNIPITGQN